MPELEDALGIISYSPALGEGDVRPLAIVQGLEHARPGVRLEWTVSDAHQLVALPGRDAWLVRSMKSGGFPLLCNNDARAPVMISGRGRAATSSPGGQPLLEVHAQLPLDTESAASATQVLEAIAEGARAYWGHASRKSIGSELARQLQHASHGPALSPRGLPMLKPPWRLSSPLIPYHLGWLNYWSAATAHALGFPDPTCDAEWLAHARRTATGGWVVRLTETPLDFDHPAHLEALRRAYERFPLIGGRASS
ncbi:DUF5953 family protein [Archangium primigenium]|uniref:DUF5953 family protein n=1 Tax=[Archangium] primigenium TaxID=2792470 RepID=UPI001EF85259|nr:DUF5953 family protein [Archangium primigenium]